MDLAAPRFAEAPDSGGYSGHEVDACVLRVREALRRTPSTMSVAEVELTRFTRVERGYDPRQVDSWLIAVAAELSIRAQAHDRALLHFGPDHVFGTGQDEPRELRGVSVGAQLVRQPTQAKTWVRVTALVLLVSLVAFYVLSYF